jgi:S-formylglutathione hydrolase FrmB
VSEAPPPEPIGSPHSLRTIVLRLLAAAAVAALALFIDRVVFADDHGHERFGARVRTLTMESIAVDREVPMKVVVPARAPSKDRSLVVFLHGRGEDERSYLVDPMFEALSELHGRAPVMAFPFGGESSYWHNRESGNWADYVLDEVIPKLITRFDIDRDRIAIGGISMGGFGAYDIARLAPGKFCAVAGHSPALWESAAETADGAFDDAEDFADNDVIQIAGTDPSPYKGMQLWLDAGDGDPFLAGDDALEAALRRTGSTPLVSHSSGKHDSDYWNGNWHEYLGFYAHALRNCRPTHEPGGADGKGDRNRKDSPGGGGRRKPTNGAEGDSAATGP